jgi:hypothetical protein
MGQELCKTSLDLTITRNPVRKVVTALSVVLTVRESLAELE